MLIRLSEEELEQFYSLVASASDPRLRRRARALLDLAAGEPLEVVARRHEVTPSTIYNWVRRYRSRGRGVAALRDIPRPGRPRKSRRADP